uniref:Uncharacterized protein n=1 Tax=Timema bartmani TaxID=61472 RepID=A0A7R9F7U6_9NEOP|nr:unnamed protein product [Timema bartmani]
MENSLRQLGDGSTKPPLKLLAGYGLDTMYNQHANWKCCVDVKYCPPYQNRSVVQKKEDLNLDLPVTSNTAQRESDTLDHVTTDSDCTPTLRCALYRYFLDFPHETLLFLGILVFFIDTGYDVSVAVWSGKPPPVHPTEIRASISPSSDSLAQQETSVLANYASKAVTWAVGTTEQLTIEDIN